MKIVGNNASCVRLADGEEMSCNVDDLISVAQFGDAIYPYLQSLDAVCNAPDSSLWRTLIEADNYHALQLLKYLYGGKVDCIYIDPPYNTRARDWKYNNDYVDASNEYRHSKWLSMMERRLKLAKGILNSRDSVLIVTIDEHEYLHLGCLLEEIFRRARIQMVSSVINFAGVSQSKEFYRTDEYIYSLLKLVMPRRFRSIHTTSGVEKFKNISTYRSNVFSNTIKSYLSKRISISNSELLL